MKCALPCGTSLAQAPWRHRSVSILSIAVVLALLPMTAAQAEDPAPSDTPAPALDGKPAVPDFSKPMGPPDRLNRGTPRGSMYGYLTAAKRGDYARAAEYMDLRQLSSADQESGPELARRLKIVLDQALWVDLQNFSDTKAGWEGDDLPAWQDRLGDIPVAEGHVTLLLQRVPRESDGVRIWKIAAATVAEIPALYELYEPVWLEAWLPRFFFERTPFDVQLWKWIALLLLLVATYGIASLIAGSTTRLIGMVFTRQHERFDDRIVMLVRGPVRLAWTVILFAIGQRSFALALSLSTRIRYLERLVLAVAAAWLVFRIIDLAVVALRHRAEREGSRGVVPVLMPASRLAKAVVVIIGALGVLGTLGVNISAAVAGLGIGGIAVALAAQKPLENLFGGISLLADRPVGVGDYLRYGDQTGTLEEIGLRSTRIRTLERTVVTIPNAEFSNLRLENFARRDRMRIQTILGVRYETSAEQLRYLLTRLMEVLVAHPRVLPERARVRFVGFGAYSLDIEVIGYVDTDEWDEFLGVREDIYLLFMGVVQESGSGFAFPSSTTYLGRDTGLDEDAKTQAETSVRDWREQGQLPFPNLTTPRRKEIEDSLDWPPPGAPRESTDT